MSEKDNAPDAFEKLIGELDIMHKALPAEDGKDDKNIQAAAEDGGDVDDEEKKEGEGDDKPMAKSLKVMVDGVEQEAIDGTELVKSLMADLTGTKDVMAKALGAAVGMIKAQGELIKSLTVKVNELGAKPAGRKTVLTVHEKPAGDLVKSTQEGVSQVEFMAKANAAFTAGKITGLDLTTIDVSLRQREPIDQSLISKVMA